MFRQYKSNPVKKCVRGRLKAVSEACTPNAARMPHPDFRSIHDDCRTPRLHRRVCTGSDLRPYYQHLPLNFRRLILTMSSRRSPSKPVLVRGSLFPVPSSHLHPTPPYVRLRRTSWGRLRNFGRPAQLPTPHSPLHFPVPRFPFPTYIYGIHHRTEKRHARQRHRLIDQ